MYVVFQPSEGPFMVIFCPLIATVCRTVKVNKKFEVTYSILLTDDFIVGHVGTCNWTRSEARFEDTKNTA